MTVASPRRNILPHEVSLVTEFKALFYQHTTIAENGCLIWAGGFNNVPSPIVQSAKRQALARRISHLMHIGSLPDKAMLRTTCENHRCVHPAHLKLVKRSTKGYYAINFRHPERS